MNDAFAKVGLDYLNAARLQVRIHLALLGEHRLRLDHLLDVVVLQNTVDNLVELLSVFGPVYFHAVLLGIGCKLVQILVQMGDGVTLDGGCLLAQLFPLVQPHGHVVTLGAHGPERGIVPVGIRLVLQELLGRFAMLCTHNFPFFFFTLLP